MKTEQEIRSAIRNMYQAAYDRKSTGFPDKIQIDIFPRLLALCHVIGVLPQFQCRHEEALWKGSLESCEFIKEMEYRHETEAEQDRHAKLFQDLLKSL